MRKIRFRAEYIPLCLAMLVMWSTLLLYVAGPIRWIDKWDFSEFITIVLLVLYFVAFAAGYILRGQKYGVKQPRTLNISDSMRWRAILSASIWINLFLTISNAQIYSSTTDIFSLFGKAIHGIIAPDEVYFGKDASSRMGNVVVWITLLYSPLMYITNVLSVYRFFALEKKEKIAVAATLVIEAARWLAVGTNKGLFDLVLLFVTCFLILLMNYHGRKGQKTEKNRKIVHTIAIVVIVLLVLFLTFFSMAISSRVNGSYHEEYYQAFPYNLIPKGLRFFVDKVDSYLIQGYNNMQKIIENCSFQWTFGVGNSRFAMQIVDKLFGIDLTSKAYPYQAQAYGIDPLASWHSAYSWFASDLTFFGVIVLMFFAGYFMCGLSHDVIHYMDPVAMGLLYLMVMMVVNASCTNYVLAYTNGFAGFWGLFWIRFLQKHKKIRKWLKNVFEKLMMATKSAFIAVCKWTIWEKLKVGSQAVVCFAIQLVEIVKNKLSKE